MPASFPCVAFIPARYDSTRFPGKPLASILGRPMFWHVATRARKSPYIDQVYLATSGGPLGTTQTPVYQVYTEAIGTQGSIQMGYASALAFILAVIIFFFTFVQRRVIERGTELY